MSKSVVRAVAVACALCACLAVASPAFAAGRGPVPNHAIVGSVDLYGLDETAAAAVISQEASVTSLPKLRTVAAGKYSTLDTPKYVTLNVQAMLDKAYAPSTVTTFTVPRMANISTPTVNAFVDSVSRKVFIRRANAYYYVRSGKLRWRKAVYGRSLWITSSRTAVMNALKAEIPNGATQPTVTLRYRKVAPAVTDKKLGRAIHVDLSQRKLRLYDHSKVIRKYGIAVGMSRYPTPRGKFKIVAKSARPAWRNPGSGWAANMPAYIPPGPSNPLGLRALYLNSPGIRIHGTSKTYSIGTAASHGCMRVANSQIVKLYPLVRVGTPVFIVK